MRILTLSSLLVGAMLAGRLGAGEKPAFDARVAAELKQYGPHAWRRLDVGVTRRGTTIPALVDPSDLDADATKFRILLVGGLDGSETTITATRQALHWFWKRAPQATRDAFSVSAIPIANPDGWAAGKGPANDSDGNPARGYPPPGDAYTSPTDPEAAYLWRWIGRQAPDLVIELRAGATRAVVPEDASTELKALAAAFPKHDAVPAGDDLASQLPRHKPASLGAVPALRIDVPAAGGDELLPRLFEALQQTKYDRHSDARVELRKRLARTPLDVARQLSRQYGQALPEVAYIPAVALMGRVRLGALTKDSEQLADVEKIVAPYLAGDKPTLPAKPSGSTLSGHLVFGELADAARNDKYVALVRQAADLGFDNGQPRAAMPFHDQMSDAVFMGCPILVQAGRLTGDAKYHDLALRHLRFMLKLNLRSDGLHQHSPLDPTAWGRGNGFPALGLALCLADLPETHPAHAEMRDALRAHLAALRPHQDAAGMWHQVIDHPGSYPEHSCTCMIAYAIVQGIRRGWLDRETYAPLARRAWQGINARIAADGALTDVCTGTGKQTSLRAYLDRPAILGKDPRGGAMALLIAVEMAAWEADGESP